MQCLDNYVPNENHEKQKKNQKKKSKQLTKKWSEAMGKFKSSLTLALYLANTWV